MAQVLPLASSTRTLDSEDLKILGTAYQQAVSHFNGYASREICSVVASRIMAAGISGQRDLKTLCSIALRGII
jgi:hypothetical protein